MIGCCWTVAVFLPLSMMAAGTQRQPVAKSALNHRSHREQGLIRKLLENYQMSLRPPAVHKNGTAKDDGPVTIFSTIQILSLSSFNDVTMTFTCQFRLKQEWTDPRLSFKDDYFEPTDFISLASDQHIWVPDTFFQNEQSGHDHRIDQMNEFLKIRSDGRVLYNKRLTMAFSCQMNLLLFPHDTQTCYIDFSSYAYTSTDIVYLWDGMPIDFRNSAIDAMPKFSIEDVRNDSCTSTTATGIYSCLRVVLRLKREVSFFLIQLYLPSCMMVAVGCVSFWIDWRSAPARVPLAIVTLLTITTQAHGINSSLPPVSYTKAIDVWIGACVVFIFGALLEFAIVNYVGTNEEKRRAKRSDGDSEKIGQMTVYENHLSNDHKVPNGVLPSAKRRRLRKKRSRNRTKSTTNLLSSFESSAECDDDEDSRGDCFDSQEYVAYRKKMEIRTRRAVFINPCPTAKKPEMALLTEHMATRAERIDMVSRVLFPIGFILFNIVYWAVYIPMMK